MGEPPTVELFKKRNHARRDVLRAMMLLVPTFRYREYWLLSRILVLFANRYNGGASISTGVAMGAIHQRVGVSVKPVSLTAHSYHL